MHETIWLGRGGQGAFTAARLLGLSAVRFANRQALAFPSFGPERRGAPVFAYTRIDERTIHDRSSVRTANAAIVMDRTLLPLISPGSLRPDSLLIIDAESLSEQEIALNNQVYAVPARQIALEHLNSEHTNTVFLGVLNGLTRLLPDESIAAGIIAEFGNGKKGQLNLSAYYYALQLGRDLAQPQQEVA